MINIGEKITVQSNHMSAEQLDKIRQLPNIVSAEYNSPLLVIKSGRGANNLENVLISLKRKAFNSARIYSELPTSK